MATQSMLRECNIREREGKMRFMQLTLGGAFASLRGESTEKERPETGACGQRSLSQPAQWVVWLGAGLALGLTGCASLSADSAAEQKQKVVAERAQARWNVLIKGDVEAAYQFLSTGSKAATPVATYKAKIRAGVWREAKVGKIDCEGEICKVVMVVTYDTRRMKGIETPVDETWVIEKGSAWYVYR
jgi:hypothetical protein